MVQDAPRLEARKLELRAHVRLAAEVIATFWPMRNFVHHNPLHGLEHLRFEDAVNRGAQLLGGNGYLANEVYRSYVASGRISRQHVDEALLPLVRGEKVGLGTKTVAHADALRTHLMVGITPPPDESLGAFLAGHPDRAVIEQMAERLGESIGNGGSDDSGPGPAPAVADLGRRDTLAAWCDRTLGTTLTEHVNREMIKWCEGFFDEDHATWAMPERERGFYGTWKFLACREWSPYGIADAGRKIAQLPDASDDALLAHLDALGIPADVCQGYLALHLAAMSGWAGYIKWRADQKEYPWQAAYPADLVEYLAVRIWYERELLHQACRERLGIDGRFDTIADAIEREWDAAHDGARRERASRLAGAWKLHTLVTSLGIGPAALESAQVDDLQTLTSWLDAFPESAHGPVWLRAFEAGYRQSLLGTLASRVAAIEPSDADQAVPVRPQAQAVFCIDVRSEVLRRHLEAIGDYVTLGFAGFFTVFIRHQALGNEHETEQFPVIVQAKNAVREVVRTYHAQHLSHYFTGTQVLHAGHELLHDLKENVVTPYVVVESVGWFYSIPLVGRTLVPGLYQRFQAWVRRFFVPRVATIMTVDKMSRDAVGEMLAAEQRAIIRRALQERFGDRDLNLSLERLEFLRRRALHPDYPLAPTDVPRAAALTLEEEAAFIEELRGPYCINQGWAFARMERITRIGFTRNEQIFTVETALRMMGLTRNFGRLVLVCGHASTSDNNPFEAALDCGACGGNSGKPNARVLATMANLPAVRAALVSRGIVIPEDTYFIAGEHDTVTDEVEFFDLEDLPHTHLMDLVRFKDDLAKARARANVERCARFPQITKPLTPEEAMRETDRRSGDWSEVRPEWGLSGNAAFLIGPRCLTQGLDLEGRVFLHSYDHREDPEGRLLEIIMTGPQVVGQWINMEHYFSAVDPEVYGSGSKIYHNVVGRFGVMAGPQSDLRTGLAEQTVMNASMPYHEPMRLLTIIEASKDIVAGIIPKHPSIQRLYENEWVHLVVLDPRDRCFYRFHPARGWTPVPGNLGLSNHVSRNEKEHAP